MVAGPAHISGKKITVTSSQQVTLTAGQSGNSLYNPAPNQTTNFIISQTVIASQGTSETGATFQH